MVLGLFSGNKGIRSGLPSGVHRKNESEKMKATMKFCAVLLALLLAGMAMVPCVSAECACHREDMRFQEEFRIVQSDKGTNLLDELGLSRPVNLENTVHLKTYTESKEIADKLLDAINLSDRSDSVIGMYDFGNYQILLISQGESILEVLSDGHTVKSSTRIPIPLGEKEISKKPTMISLNEMMENVSVNTHVQLYSTSIVSPESPSMILTLYIVTVTRTDEYRNYFGEIRASLTAKGTFYVEYGSSITGITDLSSYYTTFPYSTCEYSHYTSGVGTTVGQVNAHLKTGSLFARAQIDNWVSCNNWLTTNDGGTTSTWMSGSGDGCTG